MKTPALLARGLRGYGELRRQRTTRYAFQSETFSAQNAPSRQILRGYSEKCVCTASQVPSRHSKMTVTRPGRGNGVPSGLKPTESQGQAAQARVPWALQWSCSRRKVKSLTVGQMLDHCSRRS